MAEPALRGQSAAEKESLGDLVALAVSDISQLVRYEVDLAKLELKADARRLGIGAVLFGVAAFVGCLVLMVLSFAFAYGLMALGIWGWAAFLIVAGTYVLLAALAVLVGFTRFKGLTGLRKTRSTVSDDLALMKRDDTGSVSGSAGVR
ncbi:MAG TPA: phage holin family protein [Streptosporangiaceae bacterium]|nr:phage holin family protein [Streptosporangiaceae bacterium]